MSNASIFFAGLGAVLVSTGNTTAYLIILVFLFYQFFMQIKKEG